MDRLSVSKNWGNLDGWRYIINKISSLASHLLTISSTCPPPSKKDMKAEFILYFFFFRLHPSKTWRTIRLEVERNCKSHIFSFLVLRDLHQNFFPSNLQSYVVTLLKEIKTPSIPSTAQWTRNIKGWRDSADGVFRKNCLWIRPLVLRRFTFISFLSLRTVWSLPSKRLLYGDRQCFGVSKVGNWRSLDNTGKGIVLRLQRFRSMKL